MVTDLLVVKNIADAVQEYLKDVKFLCVRKPSEYTGRRIKLSELFYYDPVQDKYEGRGEQLIGSALHKMYDNGIISKYPMTRLCKAVVREIAIRSYDEELSPILAKQLEDCYRGAYWKRPPRQDIDPFRIPQTKGRRLNDDDVRLENKLWQSLRLEGKIY
jgi:hypothetical protein